MEVCDKFLKCTFKKCLDKNNDVNLALLLIRLMPIVSGLPSPVILLFNILIRGMLPEMNREPININYDDSNMRP